MPFIVGRAAREDELYRRLKDFVTGVGFIGRAYFTGAGNGRVIDIRQLSADVSDVYTLTCESAAPQGGSFGVTSSVRGVLPDAETNKVYLDSRAQFYLDFGSEDFEVGDTFVVKFAEYSAAAKPKLSSVAARQGTLTEQITLTCVQAGATGLPGTDGDPALFSVSGSLSGALGTCTQGVAFTSSAIDLTVARGDVTSQAEQFAEGDVIVVHTTQNELKELNQQWAVLRALQGTLTKQFGATIPAADSELILKGPGLSGTDEIFVGIRRSWSDAAGRASWELCGMRGYAAGLTYDEQPVALPSTSRPNFNTWSGELPYWISVTGRKITVKVRNNTYYMDMYLGLGIPWGSPKYQPYFLCVGGSAGDNEPSWTGLSGSNSNYWCPRAYEGAGDSSLMILDRGGVWQGILARQGNSREKSSIHEWVNSAAPSIWPFRANGMQGVRGNLDGSTPLLPVTCLPTYGELEGIFAISGFTNVEPEDLIWQPNLGKKLVVGTNTYRNSEEDFCAMELV